MFKYVELTLQLLSVVLCDINLSILHNNDIHGRFNETSRNTLSCDKENKISNGCFGGAARTVYLIKKFRKYAENFNNLDVIYLYAGDTFVGTIDYTLYTYDVSAFFMNMLQPDVQCLGSHEFDKGLKELEKYVSSCYFPTICGNVIFSSDSKLNEKIPKSVVIEKQGRKIGIIGHITTETELISNTEGIIFLDEIQTVKKESERLKKDGVNIIIVLGHSGYTKDKEIAEQVHNVDVVIGGYSHTFLWNGEQPDIEPIEGPYPTIVIQPSGKKVPVVQAYAYTKYLGILNVTFNDNGELISVFGQPILLDVSVPEDEHILNLVKIRKRQASNTVGETMHHLIGIKSFCKIRECSYGNLITDAMVMFRSMRSAIKWTDAPIGFINAGVLNGYIKGPAITKEFIEKTVPNDRMVLLKIEGKYLKKVLERSVRGTNGFLQFSGILINYDYRNLKGHQVFTARMRCGDSSIDACHEPNYDHHLVDDRTYTFVTTERLSKGAENYNILADKSYAKMYGDLGLQDIVIWYVKKYSPLFSENQGRIKIMTTKSSSINLPVIKKICFNLFLFVVLVA